MAQFRSLPDIYNSHCYYDSPSVFTYWLPFSPSNLVKNSETSLVYVPGEICFKQYYPSINKTIVC